MKDQFVLLLNNSYLNSGIPRNSGQFMADQTFHYIESTLYIPFFSHISGHGTSTLVLLYLHFSMDAILDQF